MTRERPDPLGRERSRWEILGDVLFVIGLIAGVAALTGDIPVQIGVVLFVIGMAVGIISDPLFIILTIILASALLALFKKARKTVLEVAQL